MKAVVVFGTRPEAIKMAPVVDCFRRNSSFETIVCVTGQHRSMLDQVLAVFGIEPDIDLNIMKPGQSLSDICVKVLGGMQDVLRSARPDLVLVHGDTTTAMATAMAAFHERVPIAHVEAGLRTNDIASPWPEEMNRRYIDLVGRWLFAPTEMSRQALLREHVDPSRVFVTGNTVIDALFMATGYLRDRGGLLTEISNQFGYLDPAKKLVLVTGHRRENFGDGLRRTCEAIKVIASRSDVQVVYPVHLNENVQTAVRQTLAGVDNVFLIEPLDYMPFVYLMGRSHIIITDSGGIQEEAPALGKPVLVTREVTERPEAIEAGTARLVGTDLDRIVTEATRLLEDEELYQRIQQVRNPYGDGQAARRIMENIENAFRL